MRFSYEDDNGDSISFKPSWDSLEITITNDCTPSSFTIPIKAALAMLRDIKARLRKESE